MFILGIIIGVAIGVVCLTYLPIEKITAWQNKLRGTAYKVTKKWDQSDGPGGPTSV